MNSNQPRRAMSRDVCCNQVKALFAVIREEHGEAGVEQLLDGLVDSDDYLVFDKSDASRLIPLTRAHLLDPDYWVSAAYSVRLLERVREIVPGPEPLLHTAERAMIRHLSKSTTFLARLLGMGLLVQSAPRINEKFNRTKSVKIHRHGKGKATIELHYKPGMANRTICEWNRGHYVGITKVAGGEMSSSRRCNALVMALITVSSRGAGKSRGCGSA